MSIVVWAVVVVVAWAVVPLPLAVIVGRAISRGSEPDVTGPGTAGAPAPLDLPGSDRVVAGADR